jgi:hypothetical protein
LSLQAVIWQGFARKGATGLGPIFSAKMRYVRRADFLVRQNAMFKYSINITLKIFGFAGISNFGLF